MPLQCFNSSPTDVVVGLRQYMDNCNRFSINTVLLQQMYICASLAVCPDDFQTRWWCALFLSLCNPVYGRKVTNCFSHVRTRSCSQEEGQQHFGCPTLSGVELEDFGGVGTQLSHWEKRILGVKRKSNSPSLALHSVHPMNITCVHIE